MPRLVLTGKVVKVSGSKSIVVAVARRFVFPTYGKVVTRVKKYHVHDEHESQKVGNVVKIIESKPISRIKRWVLLQDESQIDSDLQESAQENVGRGS